MTLIKFLSNLSFFQIFFFKFKLNLLILQDSESAVNLELFVWIRKRFLVLESGRDRNQLHASAPSLVLMRQAVSVFRSFRRLDPRTVIGCRNIQRCDLGEAVERVKIN